jgi:hypothetical protein
MNALDLQAGPELDAIIAEKVMGWNVCNTADGGKAGVAPGQTFSAVRIPRYSTDIAEAWEVEERIATFWRMTLPYTDALKHLCKISENDVPMTFDLVHASPYLRCQAALLAVSYLERRE